MKTPTFTPSATRRAILAAFCLTGVLMSPSILAAQGKSAPSAANELSPPQLEQRISTLEQERIALLSQIGDDGKRDSATPWASILIALAGLVGAAGTAACLFKLMRRQRARVIEVDNSERCVVLAGEHGPHDNPGPARAPFVRDSIEYDPVAGGSIRYEVGKPPKIVRKVRANRLDGAVQDTPNTATTATTEVPAACLTQGLLDPGAVGIDPRQGSECLDPLPKAQFWAAMCQPGVVIEILEPVVEKQTTPHGWLLLLEMYTLTERRSQYDALKQRFKAIFNAMLPAFDDFAASLKQRRLRDCPDLTQRIDRMLGNGTVATYLRNLLLDDRKGERRGFEMGVYCDLVRLHDSVSAGKRISTCEEIDA